VKRLDQLEDMLAVQLVVEVLNLGRKMPQLHVLFLLLQFMKYEKFTWLY